MPVFDHVCDLHLDNALMGGPHGWLTSFDLARFKSADATHLLVGGDTSNHAQDTIEVLNGIAPLYLRVIAVPGNHEEGHSVVAPAPNVTILDPLHPFVENGIGFAGGLMQEDTDVRLVVATVHAFDQDDRVTRIIVISHVAPTPRLGALFGGVNITPKSNCFLDLLGPVQTRLELFQLTRTHILSWRGNFGTRLG